MNTNKPVQKIRYGRVSATIWANATESGTRYSITVIKTYRKEDGTYVDTSNFDVSDLPLVEKAAAEAHKFLYTELFAQNNSVQEEAAVAAS
ncbi:MAG: hypothetical protein AAGG48_17590 [Planctomycetota bacterium]